MRIIVVGFLGLCLSACAGGYGPGHPNIINNVSPAETWESFTYCGGWGCSDPSAGASFEPAEWARVEALMSPPSASAGEERARVAEAIGLMEQIIGPKTGYDRDRAGTGAGIFQPGQLDCYSEAANTSSFIMILSNAGLLHYHEPAEAIMRGMATSRSWRQTHATGTMQEVATGTLWAVDSWFFPAGHAAVFVEADTWAGAWAPPGGSSL